MSMLSCLLKELEDSEIITKAPRLKGLKENNTKSVYYRKEQVERMAQLAIEIYDDANLSAAILFGAYTGCRLSELLGLQVGDVDLFTDRVVFRDTKNGTDHIIDLHPSLRSIVAPMVKGRPETAKVFQFNSDDALRYRFYKIRNLMGLGTEYNWHTLRHSTGTWLAEKGVPIQTIAAVLNHKQLTTTQRYVKSTDQARRAAINAL
jgi:integrase